MLIHHASQPHQLATLPLPQPRVRHRGTQCPPVRPVAAGGAAPGEVLPECDLQEGLGVG